MPRFAGTLVEEVKKPRFAGTPQLADDTAPAPAPRSNDPRSKQNFAERVKADTSKRYENVQNVKRQGKPFIAGSKAVGQSAALATDILSEAGVSAFRALPNSVENPIRKGAGVLGKAVAESPIGGAASYLSGKYGEFKDAHPDIASVTEDGINVAGVLSIAKPKAALGAATKTGEVAIDIAAAPIKKSIQGGKKLAEGVAARSADDLDNALIAMRDEASPLFERSKELGAVLNKPRATSIVNKMQSAIGVKDSNSARRLYGDTLSILDDFRLDLKQKDFGINDLHEYRQSLNKVIEKNKLSNPADAEMARTAKEALDDALKDIQPIDIIGGNTEARDLLLQGIDEWAKMKRFETISDMVRAAGGDPNKIRSSFKRFANKKKNLRGFTDQEKDMIHAIGDGSTGDSVLKGFGRFGIEPGNVFLPLVTGGLGGLAGSGGASGGLIAAGTVARQARKYATRAEPERLLKTIESRGKP